MGREYNTENVYSLLIDHIKYLDSAYKHFAAAVHDEGFRKFLNSMRGQEEANLDTMEQHAAELKSFPAHTEAISAVVQKLAALQKDMRTLSELKRIVFLEYMLQVHRMSAPLYRECENACQTEATAEFLHSVREDENRHIALLRDRLELEQLL